MKDILFLGDSITHGSIGSSYLKILEKDEKLQGKNLINLGENGYPLAGLALKFQDYLRGKDLSGAALIIEGGANDLLLPHMQSLGRDWNPFIRLLSRHGAIPAVDGEALAAKLKWICRLAREAGIEKMIICTIACLGEDPTSALNADRKAYNEAIRNVCREEGAVLADLDAVFAPLLRDSHSSWLFSKPGDFDADALKIAEGGEEALCRERDLKLTIDGTHLNREGARLTAAGILRALEESGL